MVRKIVPHADDQLLKLVIKSFAMLFLTQIIVFEQDGPGIDKDHYKLDATVPIRKECPPIFFACAADADDKPQIIRCMYDALQSVGVPGELHVYASGGHDFALRRPDKPCGVWPQHCVAWLRQQEFFSK